MAASTTMHDLKRPAAVYELVDTIDQLRRKETKYKLEHTLKHTHLYAFHLPHEVSIRRLSDIMTKLEPHGVQFAEFVLNAPTKHVACGRQYDRQLSDIGLCLPDGLHIVFGDYSMPYTSAAAAESHEGSVADTVELKTLSEAAREEYKKAPTSHRHVIQKVMNRVMASSIVKASSIRKNATFYVISSPIDVQPKLEFRVPFTWLDSIINCSSAVYDVCLSLKDRAVYVKLDVTAIEALEPPPRSPTSKHHRSRHHHHRRHRRQRQKTSAPPVVTATAATTTTASSSAAAVAATTTGATATQTATVAAAAPADDDASSSSPSSSSSSPSRSRSRSESPRKAKAATDSGRGGGGSSSKKHKRSRSRSYDR